VQNGDGTLKEVASNAEKAETFHRIFFPPRPAVSSVPANFQYPVALPAPLVISLDQIQHHVNSLSPYKASGPDGIPNVVLQKALEHIEDFLLYIYQALIKLGIYVDD
jgi:hypothetical protein